MRFSWGTGLERSSRRSSRWFHHGPLLVNEQQCLPLRELEDITNGPAGKINPVQTLSQFACESYPHTIAPTRERSVALACTKD